MKRKPAGILIPFHLARLLTAKKEEFRDKKDYESAQELAKAMLKLLMPE